jgi:hypothetical protein
VIDLGQVEDEYVADDGSDDEKSGLEGDVKPRDALEREERFVPPPRINKNPFVVDGVSVSYTPS